MQKVYYCLFLSAALLVLGQSKSFAQQVNKKALEKANWYIAPREFQIIDDRPVVKDFREGPDQEQTVNLAPGPGGGGSSGPGAGAGGGGGAGSTIPAGGMHFGQPSVRTSQNNLPQSGFGGSNIPARGVGGASGLPGGGLRSYMGGPKAPAASSLPAGQGGSYMPRRIPVTAARRVPAAAAPAVKSYGGYGTAPASTRSTSEELKVRGKLLRSN